MNLIMIHAASVSGGRLEEGEGEGEGMGEN